MDYSNCTLCPRCCGANRAAGQTGFCGAPAGALVSRVMLHEWEEPVLSPSGKSGAIFFGGCSLGCVYCQNYAISGAPCGTAMGSRKLRAEMEGLIAQGAENIDLVTPGHYLPDILPALSPKLSVPVIYNCGGYERVESLQALEGLVDIYLPDLKYTDSRLAARLSAAPDYFRVAAAAIREMVRQTGAPVFRGAQLVRGTVIRHLILPGQVENSLKALDWIAENFPDGQVLVSLMRQYTPTPAVARDPVLGRKVTDEEYDAVLSWMYLNDLQGFVQEESAADARYIPDF